MGFFGRKKRVDKSTDVDSAMRVTGIVRRGLADGDGDLPPAKLKIHEARQGCNPYDSGTRGVNADPRPGNRPAAGRMQAGKGWKESGFNPYDTYSNLPKQRSWEDVPFDSVDKDRRKR
ncbi:MAG: hypothetical protein WBN31_09305 [Gammaproteobacteria bacterium]